ncbi:dsDNA nuclease domain-containing protein [Clostridium tarantellae]|uniref:CD-NTase associated protein 4-like DNA endonuclease domain-containing protein n=1 Tax=Clostridium tarantellae TaxID=39493 RepID=A0A6I1MPW1_9CLOT|nr:dsDNA nuclease domain-containing protein [Clostridium tarantellae]MPQ42329.1 hypothetical protein [Clostridium tarantellae]
MDKKQVDYLQEQLDTYLSDNNIQLNGEERNKLIETLIKCDYSKAEKGGIVALRGFVYQYLVTVYYMLLIATGREEWDYVIFELGDDVALIKDNSICFCQVKTKLDDGGYINYGITSDLTKRKSGIDSWLDKLFLNSKRIVEKMNSVKINGTDDIEVSFKLIINTIFNSSSEIAPYCENSTLVDKEEKIKNRLEMIKTYKGNDYNLQDELKEKISWYIDRFDILPLGKFDELFKRNMSLVSELINDGDREITSKVVEELVTLVLFNTHDDYLKDQDSKIKFIFQKDKFIEVIKDKEKYVRNMVENTRKKKVVSSIFDKAFSNIKLEFEKVYSSILLDELNKSMLWLQESLIERVKEDEYVYEKFINRIFLLENKKTACIDGESLNDIFQVMESLKSIIIYMTFYSDKELCREKDAQLLIKSGLYKNNNTHLTTYNVRGNKSEMEALINLYTNIKKCRVINTLTGDIICFLLNFNEDEDEFDDFDMDFEEKITSSNSEFKLVTKPNNLKICKINNLNKVPKAIQKRVEKGIIRSEQEFLSLDIWDKYMDKNIKEN